MFNENSLFYIVLVVIIGSGLLAQAFRTFFDSQDVCIYAAGVSNSGCTDSAEFSRERLRLIESLQKAGGSSYFIYFGTCSIADPEVMASPYVQHKLAMEALVKSHPGNLVLRLPQVAGRTSNPHTLLNFLYKKISCGEKFSLWSKAKRNIIDVDDVVLIVNELIAQNVRNTTLNIANPVSYAMTEIVQEMEKIIGRPARYEVVDRGSDYCVDTSYIHPISKEKIVFDADYLSRVIAKYYGS